MKSKLKMAIGFGAALPIVSLVTLLGLEFNPDPVEKVSVQNMRPNEPVPSGKTLTLLSFGTYSSAGSRKHHFSMMAGKLFMFPLPMWKPHSYKSPTFSKLGTLILLCCKRLTATLIELEIWINSNL